MNRTLKNSSKLQEEMYKKQQQRQISRMNTKTETQGN